MNAVEWSHLVTEHLLKSALVLALGFALVALLRRSAPAGKHGLWQCLFAAGLAIPLLLMLPRWEIVPSWTERPAPEVPEAAAEPAALPSAVLPADDFLPFPTSGIQAAPTTSPEKSFSPFTLLFALWAAGALALLLQSVAARGFLRRLERKARQPGPRLRSQFERLRSAVGAERPVTLLLSPEVRSPFACGLARPRILLPVSAEQWPDSDLEMVLIHELEHVRRGDARAVLISRLFLSLNWINPLAWIAHRQSVRFREEACDEAVVRQGHDSRDYADLLLRQARTASASVCFSAATSVVETGTVEGRVRRVLNSGGGRSDAPGRSIRARWVALFAVAAAFAIALLGWRTVGAENEDRKEAEKSEAAAAQEEEAAKKKIEERLKRIVIPRIAFKDTPLSAALAILEQRAAELDPLGGEIRFRLMEPEDSNRTETRITMRLSNVPLSEALRYTTSLAQMKYRVTEKGVEVLPLSGLDLPHGRYVNTYSVPPSFLGANADGQQTAKETLEAIGVVFGPGAYAVYNFETNKMTVVNTLNQMTLVDSYVTSVQARSDGPPTPEEDIAKMRRNEEKLEQVIIPNLEFNEVPLMDALSLIERESAKHDPTTNDPDERGIKIIHYQSSHYLSEQRETISPITLKLTDVPLAEALRRTCSLVGMEYKVAPHAILILPVE